MKTAVKIFIMFLVVNLVTLITPQKASAQVSINFQVFYDDLSPYGNWVNNSDYGYVWIPNVPYGFTPYATNGHWVFTNVGWTWVSNYSWGWAPFHYGRWFNDPYYGWIWVPDNEWGPGWVTWRRSEGYYGWAAIGPGISISIAYSSGYSLPYNQWIFVRDRYFGSTNINNYYVNSSSNTTIINNSTVINNIQADNSSSVRYNAGPDRTEVQNRTGKVFSPIAIRERNKPGHNLSKGELQIYRPRVEKNNDSGRKPAPSKVVNLKDLKPATQRNTENHPAQQQREEKRAKQQPAQQQRDDKQTKQQPVQQQREEKRDKQQSTQQQPTQQQRDDKQTKHQPVQQQPDKPTKNNKRDANELPNKQ